MNAKTLPTALAIASFALEAQVCVVTGLIQPEIYLEANSLNFTCTRLIHHEDENANEGRRRPFVNVVLLHGFPMSRQWYMPLMEFWDSSDDINSNVDAISCDLRGYSPGASPHDVDEYSYDKLASDVYELARAAGYGQFHVIGHDHGALCGWLAASLGSDDEVYEAPGGDGGELRLPELLSYTAMSVPHPDRFSAALCGSEQEIDEEQVIAVNYFNHWSLPDAATINNASLTKMFAQFGMADDSNPEELQTKLWWYNGSMPTYMALPRILNAAEPIPEELLVVSLTREAIPLDPRPCIQQEKQFGTINVPTLMVCGAMDVFLLCTNPYAQPSRDQVPNYHNFTASTCGHDFFLEEDCQDPRDGFQTMYTITDFIFGTNYVDETENSSGDGTDQSVHCLASNGTCNSLYQPVECSGGDGVVCVYNNTCLAKSAGYIVEDDCELFEPSGTVHAANGAADNTIIWDVVLIICWLSGLVVLI